MSGGSFASGEGFAIHFDPALYDNLEDPPTEPNFDWFVFTVQPDPVLPDDGYFNALALVDNASLADPFTLTFTFLGVGTPGSQPFDLFDASGAFRSAGQTQAATAAVPEPGSASLLGSGVLGLLLFQRRRRRIR